jgi:TolB-like protein/DNA-binding winged helix-turn-helix (wHTH) protein/Flp pilus assembly protein TadD
MSETLEMIAFGPFRLEADRRKVTCAGAPVALSARGFDILALLIEHRDRVVTKDEIMTHVWRGMIVEENNLAVQVSALRRALAQAGVPEEGRTAPVILTVPGQGYRFVARIGPSDEASAPARVPTLALDEQTPLRIPALPQELAPAPPAARARGASVPAPSNPGGHAPAGRIPVVFMTLAACMLTLGAAWLFHPNTPPAMPPAVASAAPPRLSIAVLPFRDLSDDRCCDYLADAISDDLTTDLSLIPGSVVIARESADLYRNHPAPAGTIGRELNVRYLLEGSLRSVDGIFSINAQLIEAATGGHLWAERFAVPRSHLAEAQAAIVQRLASALGVKLVAIEGERSLREHPQNPDVLDLFLRARSVLDRSDSLQSLEQAQALLEQARVRQPDDVKVLSELGWLLPRKIHNYVTPHRDADLAEARLLLARAQALAPRDPSVLAAVGGLHAYDGDYDGGITILQAALDGEPGNTRALAGLIFCKFQLAQFGDAAASLTTLMRVDPESPRQKMRFYQMGMAQLMLGQPAAALPWLRRATAGDPDPAPGAEDLGISEWTQAYLIAALRLSGDRAGADALFAKYRAVWPYRSRWTLESRSPRVFSTTPGFQRFLAALEDSGMRQYVDEGSGAAAGLCGASDLHPTPRSVAGVSILSTQAVQAALQSGGALAVDFGVGGAVPPGVQHVNFDPSSTVEMAALQATPEAARARMILVMGSSVLDPRGCQAAQLRGWKTPVFWYRGGEEAWAAAGLAARDLR